METSTAMESSTAKGTVSTESGVPESTDIAGKALVIEIMADIAVGEGVVGIFPA